METLIYLGLLFLAVNKILNILQNRAIQKRKKKQINVNQPLHSPFKVVSYNILAKNLMHQEPLPNKMQLTIENTLKFNKNSLYPKNPDIICYQEVDSETHDQLCKNLKDKGFETKSNINQQRHFGVLLAWNKSRYQLKSYSTICLDEVADKLDFGGIQNSQQQRQLFKRGHVALIAQLNDKFCGVNILATTIHAFWDPKYQYVKYAEIAYVCDMIQTMKKTKKIQGPIIFGGDFNSLPYSDVVRYLYKLDRANLPNQKMLGGEIKKPQIIRRVIEKFGQNERVSFRSAYDMYFQNSSQIGMQNVGTWSRLLKVAHPQFTNWTTKFRDTLDYIFYTPSNCTLVELNQLPSVEYMKKNKIAKLPNEVMKHGSDHLPIGAVFSYNKKYGKHLRGIAYQLQKIEHQSIYQQNQGEREQQDEQKLNFNENQASNQNDQESNMVEIEQDTKENKNMSDQDQIKLNSEEEGLKKEIEQDTKENKNMSDQDQIKLNSEEEGLKKEIEQDTKEKQNIPCKNQTNFQNDQQSQKAVKAQDKQEDKKQQNIIESESLKNKNLTDNAPKYDQKIDSIKDKKKFKQAASQQNNLQPIEQNDNNQKMNTKPDEEEFKQKKSSQNNNTKQS